MKIKHILVLFAFLFSFISITANVSAITGNWLVCGDTECPGCKSSNWDNCVWRDGIVQCPSTCSGSPSTYSVDSCDYCDYDYGYYDYGYYDYYDYGYYDYYYDDYYCDDCYYYDDYGYYDYYDYGCDYCDYYYPECYSDYDCPYGYTCSGGYCVYYPPTPPTPTPCTRQNPTVMTTPSSQEGSAGSCLFYTVQVTNNDDSNCDGSTFSLTSSCPSGWSCYFDTNSLTISSGNTGSTTMKVTSSSSASGSNSFSATATYSHGSGTGYATYVVSGDQCSEGYLDSYRCSGDSRERLYRYSDCRTEWRHYEHCSNGCSGGVCSSGCTTCDTPYYPPVYYPTTYVMDAPQKMEVATIPCQVPYEGEVAKAQVFTQTRVSTPSEGWIIILFLLVLLLLLLFALAALALWLRSKTSSRKPRTKTVRRFFCWNENSREPPEGF